ncbi:hypothetical protein GCM10010394_39560 [Streptomyces crystallinus]|uniref:Uncharacterized protein n=1 Tax=Streptomyces crystallinus TaxID=68191 RepID=A0ABN1G7W7_9ACTN
MRDGGGQPLPGGEPVALGQELRHRAPVAVPPPGTAVPTALPSLLHRHEDRALPSSHADCQGIVPYENHPPVDGGALRE